MSLTCFAGSQDAEEELSLPEELLTGMLWKMPGQNVHEFRCLSKYHKELIDGEDFIRNHYDLSIKQTPSIIIHQKIKHESDGKEAVATYLNLESGDCKSFRPPLDDDDEVIRFLGSRRGILCHHVRRVVGEDSHEDHIVFWNPLTGASRRAVNGTTDRSHFRHYFFGYDAETDDFKVLMIEKNGFMDCLVYSSRTDSWTEIWLQSRMADAYKEYRKLSEVFVEGTNCLHVLASVDSVVKILAFDFRAEKMEVVGLPESCRKIARKKTGLSSVDGCLCLSYQPVQPGSDANLNLWMMKEYGDEKSWSLVFSIQPGSIPANVRRPNIDYVVIRGRPQLLLGNDSSSRQNTVDLYLYDVGQRHFNDAQRHHFTQFVHHFTQYETLDTIPQHCLFVPSRRKP